MKHNKRLKHNKWSNHKGWGTIVLVIGICLAIIMIGLCVNRFHELEDSVGVSEMTSQQSNRTKDEIIADEKEVTTDELEREAYEKVQEEATESQENNVDIPMTKNCMNEMEQENVKCKIETSLNDIFQMDAYQMVNQNGRLTEKGLKQIVTYAGERGIIAVSEKLNMQNYSQVEEFYEKIEKKQDDQIFIYEFTEESVAQIYVFTERNNELQRYFLKYERTADGKAHLIDEAVTDVNQMRMTEKGYLIYHCIDAEYVGHCDLYEAFRIKPLKEEYRTLTEKYFSYLGCMDYELFTTNWNEDSIEQLDFAAIYEDLDSHDKGETVVQSERRVEKEQYESLIMQYFPITAKQLQEQKAYEKDTRRYQLKDKVGSIWQPVLEVTDCQILEENRIQLTVDAVWIAFNTDLAFQDTVVIQLQSDGTYQYDSCTVKVMDMAPPEVYDPLK